MDDLDKRFQTLIVLWAALMMNVVTLFVVALIAPPKIVQPPASASLLSFIFAAVGVFCALLSFVIKKRILRKSVDDQNVLLVQKALIIGCAMCEVCALMGLIEAFVVGGYGYYVLFLIGFAAMALHMPRRVQLQSASYKKGNTFAV